MFAWDDAFRIAAMAVTSVGGIAVVISAAARLLADRLTSGYQRRTDTMLAEMRGRVDEGLSRLSAALQHQNFVLQRLAEIELNGIHSCWRAAATSQHVMNGVRPHDCGTDPDALLGRIKRLRAGHDTLLTLIGKYDPFLNESVRTMLHEVARILRLEIGQSSHDPFVGRWWDQGDTNRADLETQIVGLRAAVQLRIVLLRQLAAEPGAPTAGARRD